MRNQLKNIVRVTGIGALTFLANPGIAFGAEADGAALYDMYCVQCHGTQGNGKGINASHINVQPRSHIDKGEMSARSDAELFKVIAEGGPAINKSVLMPAWRHNLNESEIEALVAHLRKLCCEN
ncbi:MAG: cytochrome c [Pseudohongiella sp.]|nr:cytochrome c [Pseudohongiella sp.]MDO9519423.1 cytochrome c [Pseudohongiella sp.]